jgi:hypothetical protein
LGPEERRGSMPKQDRPQESWRAVKAYHYADKKDWRLASDGKGAESEKKPSPSLNNPFKGRR